MEMVSRRNFISIIIMMLTLAFMFQAIQFYYEYIAKVDRNIFIPEHVISGFNAWKTDAFDILDFDSDSQYVLFVGNDDGNVGRSAEQWCNYTKRNFVACEDLSAFSGDIGQNQEYLLIESAYLDVQQDMDVLSQFAEAGVRIVFCDLPEVNEISRSTELQNILGIHKILEDNTTVEGIRLFSGFLLGGEMIYSVENELLSENPVVPWYQLGAGTQTYMVGILDEQDMAAEEITREMLPALMWSYSNGSCNVFVVNGDYMHDNTGIGILSAIDAKLSDYALYPILNAQLLTVANYPGLADENKDVIQRIFSGSMIQAGRDIVYPQMVATAAQTGFVMSCMLQTQYDYQDASLPEVYSFKEYSNLMKKAGAEMGLSLERTDEVVLEEKLDDDMRFFEQFQNRYQFGAVYTAQDEFQKIADAKALPDSINTVVSAKNEEQDLISFGNDDITIQSITNDGSVHSFRSDLYMRSVQTALGYTNILLDLNRVFWPGENELSWEKLSKVYADNLYTYWRPFQSFEDVTVSQNDQKIRQLLTMDYSHVRKGNVICLELENTTEPVHFILRLHNMKPDYIEGGSWIELEENIYLIKTNAQQYVDIHLTSSYPINN